MSKRMRAACESLLASESTWTLSSVKSGDAGSGDCECCSPVKRRLTVSLSEDESDADTRSLTSDRSPDGDEDQLLDNDDALDGRDGQELAPSMEEQSPIDIRPNHCQAVPRRKTFDRVAISSSSNEAELQYTGEGFSVRWAAPTKNTLVISGKVYQAVQFHFHTPSEHTLDGDHEAMELHLVHEAADGSLAVVAVFFREGKQNVFLSQFWHELSGLKLGVETTIPLGDIDPTPLNLLAGGFFRYQGSLTTPPYTEGVQWVVVQEVAEASREQLEAFRNVLPAPNARPVQPLHTRDVTLVHFNCGLPMYPKYHHANLGSRRFVLGQKNRAKMEPIMQMMDDMHKLKKLMDIVFEKMESHSTDKPYDAVEAYADKDRILEILNRLSSRMADSNMSNLTASPKTDATPEEIAELKQNIQRIETERQSIHRRAGASLKGVL